MPDSFLTCRSHPISIDSRIEILEKARDDALVSSHELAPILVAIINDQLIDLRAAQ
ncbi:hypothetical protein [Paenirhodobacter populi]|uniref:hypothetical protein n=1 Tax=Paenirhodobacter populi TaxID=2306993 RepID=UPI0013E35790|nr:hypothetical protein [Sinirhodobacter populi]